MRPPRRELVLIHRALEELARVLDRLDGKKWIYRPSDLQRAIDTVHELGEHLDNCDPADPIVGDMLGFGFEALAPFVSDEGMSRILQRPFEPAGPPTPITEAEVSRVMRDYLTEYGFEKAIDHRGLSADRTVIKLAAWAWLLGWDDLVTFATDPASYAYYGVPVLKRFATRLGVPVPQGIADWPDGQPCSRFCREGCVPEDPR